jgi:hypothetical protein
MWKFWNLRRVAVDCFLVTAQVNRIDPLLAKGDE